MSYKMSFALLALAAAPLSAQIVARNPARDRVITRTGGEVARSRTSSDVARSSEHIPPGHLPPRGMCRVWVDGVPPGHQPPVTDCATAERNRVANSRVIYGDRESFPGRGKGAKHARDDDAIRRDDDDEDDDRVEKRQKREAKALKKANKGRAKAAAKHAKNDNRDD